MSEQDAGSEKHGPIWDHDELSMDDHARGNGRRSGAFHWYGERQYLTVDGGCRRGVRHAVLYVLKMVGM